MKIKATVTSGRLPKAYSDVIRQELLRLDGKVVTITIREVRDPAKNHLGYWRGVMLPKLLEFYMECGDPKDPDSLSKEMVRDIAKIYTKYVKTNGEVELQAKSTSEFEPEDWNNLFNAVKAWAPAEINFD